MVSSITHYHWASPRYNYSGSYPQKRPLYSQLNSQLKNSFEFKCMGFAHIAFAHSLSRMIMMVVIWREKEGWEGTQRYISSFCACGRYVVNQVCCNIVRAYGPRRYALMSIICFAFVSSSSSSCFPSNTIRCSIADVWFVWSTLKRRILIGGQWEKRGDVGNTNLAQRFSTCMPWRSNQGFVSTLDSAQKWDPSSSSTSTK